MRFSPVLPLLLLTAILTAPRGDAQSCSGANGYSIAYSGTRCGTPGFACQPGEAVVFSLLRESFAGPLSCITSAEWNFGDGTPVVTRPGVENVSHSFAAAGTYTVRTKIVTALGSATLVKSVEVAAGEIRLIGTSVTANEGTTAKIAVGRSGSSGVSTISWKTRDDSAKAGTDFTPSSGTITIADGASTSWIEISLTNDGVYTRSRSFYVELVSATGPYLLIAGTASVTINDDDPPAQIFFSMPSNPTFDENAGTAKIVVRRDGDLASRVSVTYEVVPPYYGTTVVFPTRSVLTFESGETEKSFEVTIVDDDLFTGTRSAVIYLHSPSAGAILPNASYDNRLYLYISIRDDEGAGLTVSVSDASAVEGESGTTKMRIPLTIPKAIERSVDVTWSVSPGTASRNVDYVHPDWGGYLNIPAGQTEAFIEITIKGDVLPEEDETFTVAINSYYSVLPIGRRQATATILDDDEWMSPHALVLARGTTGGAHIDVGLPVESRAKIALAATNPEVISIPAEVTVAPGTATAVVEIKALAVGGSSITATLPNGVVVGMEVTVHDSARLRFEPGAISAFAGDTIDVKATLDPPSAQAHTLSLTNTNPNAAAVDAAVTIPAGASGTFRVRALDKGTSTIQAKLPQEYGGSGASLVATIATAPDRPTLASVNPPTGPAAGGTPFEARGAHFAGDCTLFFGEVAAREVAARDLAVSGADRITGTTPHHAAGTVNVTLTCGASRHVLANAFTFIASQPSVSSVSPAIGSIKGGTHVRIAGANLYSGCWPFFGGVAAEGARTLGATEMTAMTPAGGKSGSVDVTVRCPDGSAGMLSRGFAFTPANDPSAAIASVDPLVGSPGESVTITGSRFRPSDRVAFDALEATMLRSSPGEHVVRIPDLPLGATSIHLTDVNGNATTTGPIFTILEPTAPFIERVTPKSISRGSEIVLEGRGFRPAYRFVIGDAVAQVVSLEYSRAVVRVSTEALPGARRIEIRNAEQKLAALGPLFTVSEKGAAVLEVSPPCGLTEGRTEVVILGSGFQAGARVTFGGVPAGAVTVVSETEIHALTPPGPTGNAAVQVTNRDGSTAIRSDAFRYDSPFDPAGGCGVRKARTVRR